LSTPGIDFLSARCSDIRHKRVHYSAEIITDGRPLTGRVSSSGLWRTQMIRGHSVTVEQSFNFMFKWFPVTAITAVHFSVTVRRTVVPPLQLLLSVSPEFS